MDILYTGPTGSIGSQMPPGPIPLLTRLEATVEERVLEIERKSDSRAALIHLAALVSIDECEKDPQRTFAANVDGSLKWLESAIRTGVKRFVFVSTAHVFAPSDKPLDIDSPLGPRSIYAKSKLAAENALRRRAEAHGIELIIARVFSVLSPANRKGFLLHALEKRARENDLSPIPGLDFVRDFLWADEICKRLCELARAKASPKLSLICSGKATPVRALANDIFLKYGRDPSLLRAAPKQPGDIPCMVGTV